MPSWPTSTARGRRLRPPAVLMPAFRRVDASRRAIASLGAGVGTDHLRGRQGGGGRGDLAREFPDVDVIRTTWPAWWTGAIVLGIEAGAGGGDEAVLFFNQDVTCATDYSSG